MILLSYNLSPILKELLTAIDTLRKDILLEPINPKNELKLKWEAMIERTYWLLRLRGRELTKHEIAAILGTPKKRYSAAEWEVLHIKTAFEFIESEWLIQRKTLTFKAFSELAEFCNAEVTIQRYDDDLKAILKYLTSGNDHPVVGSGLIEHSIGSLDVHDERMLLFSRIASYLYLYKNAYNFRGFYVKEEGYDKEKSRYSGITNESLNKGNLTLWLEFYAELMVKALQKQKEHIEDFALHIDMGEQFWDLNERQKTILVILDNPNTTITNRDVQKHFSISQITASRDLSRLASLGLLYPHGKGRSVYYTKI